MEKNKVSKKMKSEKAITIVALIVAVVVMLILATISINMLSGENGIIKQAKSTKEAEEISNEQGIIQRSVLEITGGSKNVEIKKETLEQRIKENSLTKIEISESQDNFIVKVEDSKRRYFIDKSGAVEKITWWKEKDKDGNSIITDGKTLIKVGDYVNYNPLENTSTLTYKSEKDKNGSIDQEFSSDAETGGWRVLDVNYTSEGENIILISANAVQTTENKDFELKGLSGYLYGEDELNNACEIFGAGKGAVKAKSIAMEDINKITGYNPMKTGDGKIYKQGEIGEYKNKITIKKESTWKWTGTSTNGSTWETTYQFRRMDKNGEWTSMKTTGDTFTFENTYYYYNPITLTDSDEGEEKGISSTSKEFSMLFGKDNIYFIATKFMNVQSSDDFVHYNIFRKPYAYYFVAGHTSASLTGSGQPRDWNKDSMGIRPLVYLSNKATLVKTDEKVNGCNKWNISIE